MQAGSRAEWSAVYGSSHRRAGADWTSARPIVGGVIWRAGRGIRIILRKQRQCWVSQILIVPNRRRLVFTITAFTVAHSLTLALAALGFVQGPSRPVEATIALSILLLATEVMRVRRGQVTLTSRWPWAVTD